LGLFFPDFGRAPCFWAKNGGWHVNLRSLGRIDKKNAQKTAVKRAKNWQKFVKIYAFWVKIDKNW